MRKQILKNIMLDLIHSMEFPNLLNECLISDEVLEAMVIEAQNPSQPILNENKDELVELLYEDYLNGNLDEGLLKMIAGGLTGLILGQKIGEAICKILGIGDGPLRNLLTSKIVSTSLGVIIGKNFGKK
ncbi:MAG: hypothetical protein FWC41_12660 [Firmicutes bacterium]|nr:hypothetical protein [Bacillota bacterium]